MLIRKYLIMQDTGILAEGDAVQSNLRRLQREDKRGFSLLICVWLPSNF